jgi:hypothetical protein
VKDSLRGFLAEFERRCTTVRDRIADLPDEQARRDHTLAAYKAVEQLRRGINQLASDPTLGDRALLATHLRLYTRYSQDLERIESYLLPFLERFNDDDRRLTALCQRLASQVRWPLTPPLVASFSSQYYWTVAPFGIICTPAAEGTSLLGLPDLCHELGHNLMAKHRIGLIGNFLVRLATYVSDRRAEAQANQRPPEHLAQLNMLFAQWGGAWLGEFVADLIATFLCGPAFGWQHIRLCAGTSAPAFAPALGDVGDHPADEARLRGVVVMLRRLGLAGDADRLQSLWNHYVAVTGETPPPEYDLCFPDELIDGLAERVDDGCRALGVRPYDRNAGPDDLPRLLSEAWTRFRADPDAYGVWQTRQLKQLWQSLGF